MTFPWDYAFLEGRMGLLDFKMLLDFPLYFYAYTLPTEGPARAQDAISSFLPGPKDHGNHHMGHSLACGQAYSWIFLAAFRVILRISNTVTRA